jgi:uncharacterized protein
MILEGVVTNVTNFGAFIDIGVHQDGLAHISQLADRFVKDPHEVVQAGKVVKVKVLEVDQKRKRIALTLKLKEAVSPRPARSDSGGRDKNAARDKARSTQRQARPVASEDLGNSLADAFAKARR